MFSRMFGVRHIRWFFWRLRVDRCYYYRCSATPLEPIDTLLDRVLADENRLRNIWNGDA